MWDFFSDDPVLQQYENKAVSPGQHASVMVHGWLFGEFLASDRRAHQCFPLFSITAPRNVAVPVASDLANPRQWLRTAAGDGRYTYADQHVHRDEPVDLGGLFFSEVFQGSDMARFALADRSLPASFSATVVDVESRRAMVAVVVLLPGDPDDDAAADAIVDAAIRSAASPADIGKAIGTRWGSEIAAGALPPEMTAA